MTSLSWLWLDNNAMTGPFPTELTDEIGKFLQVEGMEVGTVTGRDRRCGWIDLVALKYTFQLERRLH